MFNLFDKLLLLSRGKPVYCGAVGQVHHYFQEQGHPMPTYVNPAEFLLGLVNTDGQRSTANYTPDFYRLRDGSVVDDIRYNATFSRGDAITPASSNAAMSNKHCSIDHHTLEQELNAIRADSLLETLNNLYQASVHTKRKVHLCSTI